MFRYLIIYSIEVIEHKLLDSGCSFSTAKIRYWAGTEKDMAISETEIEQAMLNAWKSMWTIGLSAFELNKVFIIQRYGAAKAD